MVKQSVTSPFDRAGRCAVHPGYVAAMLDHLSIQCVDVTAAAAFYDTVLATIGGKRILDFGPVIGYGVDFPCFWLGPLEHDGPNRADHIAFRARTREEVHAWFDAAVGLGAEVLHEPRVWPEYHPHYYGAFVRDPDGNNVEAVCHKPADES
jgi:catechol 2,3-dioxygenase-like lactoylglutathione lyase family enzyme